MQNSAESPACRLPTAHPSPILSPISLNISLLYILIFSAAATKRKLNELKPIKYKGPQLCLWDEGVCGLLQLPHEKIVIVTSPDAAVCRAAAVLQSPRGCSAAPRPRCSCGGWSRSTSACSGSWWTAVDSWQQSVRRRRPGVTQLVTCQHVLPPGHPSSAPSDQIETRTHHCN